MLCSQHADLPPQLLVEDRLPIRRLANVHVVGVDLRVDADAGIGALRRDEGQVQSEVRRGLGLSEADHLDASNVAGLLTLRNELLAVGRCVSSKLLSRITR